jgi:TRAP-type C4-dicarboxylate transport system permease small subunit
MRRLDRRAHQLAEGLAGAAISGLLLLAFGTAIDVLMRYAFATPIRGFIDVVSLAGAVLLSACMPHVVASRGNIAVDFLGQGLGPRPKRWLDTFGAVVTGLFFSLMAWQFVRYALEMKQTAQVTPVLRWPVWPWWSAVAAFITLTALVALCTLRTEPATPEEGT